MVQLNILTVFFLGTDSRPSFLLLSIYTYLLNLNPRSVKFHGTWGRDGLSSASWYVMKNHAQFIWVKRWKIHQINVFTPFFFFCLRYDPVSASSSKSSDILRDDFDSEKFQVSQYNLQQLRTYQICIPFSETRQCSHLCQTFSSFLHVMPARCYHNNLQ